MVLRSSWRLCLAVTALLAAAGCASGVSNCRRNAKDNLRSTGRGLQSWDVVGTAIDVVALPVTATATCAKDLAVSPVYEAADMLRVQRIVKAERVTADDPRVKRAAARITAVDLPPSAAAAGAPSAKSAKCEYRTPCVTASTLLVSPSRSASSETILIGQEHQQYELTNNCAEAIDCYVCGTKDGKISRSSGATCADATIRKLEPTETWVGDGSAEDVDGMAMTCLVADASGHVACRTWPE
jgi:hypothetical protein